MNNRNQMQKGYQYPLIQISIDLSQNRTDKIILYRHTDPNQEAASFVYRNNIEPKLIPIISNSIIKLMKAYDEMMIITINLKQNHLELQQKLKTSSPQRLKSNQQNLNISKSNEYIHDDDLPTDKVIIKKLFSLLDTDYDGLISINKVNLQNIPNQLKNKIQNKIQTSSNPLDFELFYLKIKEDSQEEYFQSLKLISQMFNISRIKVLI
ncbi:unnamed protein product [Paramecium sonneborni]|uniref:EF-hand domain-containing protein n=1 Tax=Paramecium sonneborni TaxID=65129 RepID=A0A8S1KXD8_9CILI|nr:unnamed protein product [Paramecium sonneborni]